MCSDRVPTGCWHLVADEEQCRNSGVKLTVEREKDSVAADDTLSVARCLTCADPRDPRCQH